MSLVGSQLGRYKILEQLGQGGMSIVYRGLDTSLQREVAVKVLHAHLALREDSRARMGREARAVARLSHPNILEVYDFEASPEGEPYIVTELIRGCTLREFASREPFDPPEIAAMVVQELANALAHAHQAGVIHRDLKPENIMAREDGMLKLMDFGISKILDREQQMTATGTLVGSPAHMAPEIIEGHEATVASDIFSLGTLFYFFATNTLPFVADNPNATFKKILTGTYEDPRISNPRVSDRIAQIINTCLAVDPVERWPNAEALRDALARYLSDFAITQPEVELKAFFAGPATYRAQLKERLVRRLLESAARSARRRAAAMSDLNHLLALEPDNVAASDLLGAMQVKVRRATFWRRVKTYAAVGVGVLALLGAAGVAFERSTRVDPFIYRRPFAPWDVTLGKFVWPERIAASVKPRVIAPEPPRAGTRALPPLPPPLTEVSVSVVVRPFGRLKIDDREASAEALSLHKLEILPGKHSFRVLCELCDPEAPAVIREVAAGDQIALVAQLKPAAVTFVGFPAGARIVVNKEVLNPAQVNGEPFPLRVPAAGLTSMRYEVNFVARDESGIIDQGRQWVTPGTSVTISNRGKR